MSTTSVSQCVMCKITILRDVLLTTRDRFPTCLHVGNDDEYVVSGSDDGNFFIWDRKTTKLVNILDGDGEVVNVVQGHPYETMLAVSGIDNTIKVNTT